MSLSSKRWVLAAAGSILSCGLSFAYLNRNGCWVYWRGSAGITCFLFAAIVLLLLFGLRWQGRGIVLVAAILVYFFGGPEIFWNHNAKVESRAVATLRVLQSDLEEARTQQPTKEYPQILPDAGRPSIFSESFHPAYRYEYVASHSADGKIIEYLIRATPSRPDCGCCLRSFTILNDRRIYYTLEQRPATMLDSLLQ